MSRYGMKVAEETLYGIQHPDEAIRLIKKVVEQYFGELWTQHKPRCPLCDTALADCEKHMNRPVGECTNPKCDSTIHIADYLGKILDIIAEAEVEQKQRLEEEAKKAPTKSADNDDDLSIELNSSGGTGRDAHDDMAASSTSTAASCEPTDEDLVFIW
jgi:hypothetical protein